MKNESILNPVVDAAIEYGRSQRSLEIANAVLELIQNWADLNGPAYGLGYIQAVRDVRKIVAPLSGDPK